MVDISTSTLLGVETDSRTYDYVGPAGLAAAVSSSDRGCQIRSITDLDDWLSGRPSPELEEPFTFIIDLSSALRLAVRRSEHVACAGGDRVLAAGEIGFRRTEDRWVVTDVSNHSTGYCPDISSWSTIADTLDRAGLDHPAFFTHEVVFRRCELCRELNIVREDDYVCVFCNSNLPEAWNL